MRSKNFCYKGEFVNNNKEGRGIYSYFKDDSIIVITISNWRNDKINGYSINFTIYSNLKISNKSLEYNSYKNTSLLELNNQCKIEALKKANKVLKNCYNKDNNNNNDNNRNRNRNEAISNYKSSYLSIWTKYATFMQYSNGNIINDFKNGVDLFKLSNGNNIIEDLKNNFKESYSSNNNKVSNILYLIEYYNEMYNLFEGNLIDFLDIK